MTNFGPISLLAVGFPDAMKLKGELMKEIFSLKKAGIIRVVGLLAIVKDANGRISAEQVTDLSKEDRVKLGSAIGALIGFGAAGEKGLKAGMAAGAQHVAGKEFGLSQEQIRNIARDMRNGTAAGFLLIEHLWAKRLKEIADQQEGFLIANAFITPQALVAIGEELAEGARIAEQVQYQ